MATSRGPEPPDSPGGGGGLRSPILTASEQPIVTAPQQPILTAPIVLDRRGGGKRRRRRGRGRKKYTRGTKAMQRFLFGSSRAAWRVSNSLASGMNLFVRRSRRSMRRRKDGLLRDSFRNAARGFGRASSEFGRAPYEIARRVGTNRVRRTFRFFLPVYR